jgi:hypothetical protein
VKYLLAQSILHTLLKADDESQLLLEKLESTLSENHKFYMSAVSIFEIIQSDSLVDKVDQKEFLNQSGILCDEIYPITKDDLNLYPNLSAQLNRSGLEVIETCVAIHQGMDSILTWKSSLPSTEWMKVKDLAKED